MNVLRMFFSCLISDDDMIQNSLQVSTKQCNQYYCNSMVWCRDFEFREKQRNRHRCYLEQNIFYIIKRHVQYPHHKETCTLPTCHFKYSRTFFGQISACHILFHVDKKHVDCGQHWYRLAVVQQMDKHYR